VNCYCLDEVTFLHVTEFTHFFGRIV
jgi:hypothetical protein